MLSKKRLTQIIGSNIKKMRIQKGMSQEELAHECGFYRTYINLIETARRTPSSYSLYKLAKGLKTKVDDLYPSIV